MAAITAAVIGAGGALLASKKAGDAAKDAAKTVAAGQTQALDATNQAAAQAGGDVNRLFGTAADASNQGFQNALDFTAGSIPQQVAPFQQGNVLAQEQLGRGLQQQQNALFGGPVDLSGFQARQIGQPQDFAFNLPQQQQAAQPVASNPLAVGGPQANPANQFFGGGSNIFSPATLANLNTGGFNPNTFQFEGEQGIFG